MRLFQTVRKLRASQAAALLKHRARTRMESLGPAPQSPPLPEIRLGSLPFIPPLQEAGNAEIVQTGRLTFLNRTENVGWTPTWDLASVSKLWAYNLHYHDFLWVLSFEDALSAVRSWIDDCPNARGAVGWDPYPISLRIQNWCMYFFGRHRATVTDGCEVAEEIWRSIFHQLSVLEKRIERHLLGNHILENGAALSFAGATFGGPIGDRWLREGLELLREHLDEIVLADGGHAERSPMYHARLCQMMENLVRTRNEHIVDAVEEPLKRAWPVLSLLSHPDQEIALLNDSALGVYPGVAEMGMRSAESGLFKLPDSGYFGGLSVDGHYIVCDAGPVGPDYQPGHAHGDTLSFELSIHGVRFVVDSGVFNYEDDRWRAYARSTRAHNTVELNRLGQCDFWGTFRVGRRAYPRNVVYHEDANGFSLEAEHTGYDHLAGRPIHRRRFRWFEEGILMVRDRIAGSKPVWAASYVHLHPDVQIEHHANQTVVLRRGDVSCTMSFIGTGRLTIESSWYFPEFGRMYCNSVLVISQRGKDLSSGFCVAPGQTPPVFDLDQGARLHDAEYRW